MNPKNKIIITSVICFLIFLILVFFIIYPLIKKIKQNSENLLNLKRELKFQQSQEKTLSEFKELYNKVEPDFVKVDNLLVDSDVPVELIKFLENTAKDQKISVEISTGSFKKQEKILWDSMYFQIAIAGPFSNFLRFVEKIESGPFLLRITSLSVQKLTSEKITQGDKKKIPEEVSGNLSIEVFTSPD